MEQINCKVQGPKQIKQSLILNLHIYKPKNPQKNIQFYCLCFCFMEYDTWQILINVKNTVIIYISILYV